MDKTNNKKGVCCNPAGQASRRQQLVQWLRTDRTHYSRNAARAALAGSRRRQLINWLNGMVFYIVMFTQLSSDNVARARPRTRRRTVQPNFALINKILFSPSPSH